MARIAVREALTKSSPRRRGSSNDLNILGSRLRGNDKTIFDQCFFRPSRRRSIQRGQVLLGIVVILAIVFGTLFYSFVRPASSTIERDKITSAALALAKDALIGYAAKHATRPGALPCPDIFNTGNDPGLSGNNCQSYIGRLPWKSLGLTDIRDGSGERLWYALSPNFRNRNPPPGPVLNSDTPGQLTVIGTSPSNTAIAIIFAPGSAVGTQVRAPADANNVANYLEGENANGDTIFTTAPPSSTFNDKLLLITSDNFFPAVEKRVAQELRQNLRSYYSNNHYYPPTATFSGTTCATGNYRGRIPTSSCSPLADVTLPPWFTANNWQEVMVYAVARRCTPSIASPFFSATQFTPAPGCTPWFFGLYICNIAQASLYCGNTGSGSDLMVTGVGNSIEAIVIAAGHKLGSQARPCAAVADCLEAVGTNNENIDAVDNYVYVKPERSSTNNDSLAIVAPYP